MKFQIQPHEKRQLGAKRVAKILEAVRAGEWPTDDEVIDAIMSVPAHFVNPVESVVLGYEPYIRINSTPFGVSGGNVEIVYDKHMCADSETGRSKASKRGMNSLTASLNFFGKKDVDYHNSPLLLSAADTEEHIFWLYTYLGAEPYKCPSFTFYNYRIEWTKEGGGIAGSMNGESNGRFFRPGES